MPRMAGFASSGAVFLIVLLVQLSDALAQPATGSPDLTERRRGESRIDRLPMAIPPILAALDKDEDGEISALEMGAAQEALKQLDSNRDGELTFDEFMNRAGAGNLPFGGTRPGFQTLGFPLPVPPLLTGLDDDGDGELSADEISRSVDALKKLDKNQDGELAADELIMTMPSFRDAQRGRPGGGGPGGPMHRRKVEVLEQFDADKDGMLDRKERVKAKQFLSDNQIVNRHERGGPPGPFGNTANSEPLAGQQLKPGDVPEYPKRGLFDPDIIRTFFFEFESSDWEEELEVFRNTDVEVPARLIVDGEVLEDVGMRFRGNTSYMMVPRGLKRSLNVSLDLGDSKQRLHGVRTLNLLNSNSDPSFLRNVLYNRISRDFLPALEANLVRVVINSESWGLYVNEEQFNKDFLEKWYDGAKCTRWKIPANFSGSSGLMYLGEDLQLYKSNYQLKSKEDDNDWSRLRNACRVIHNFDENQDLEALGEVLDINEALWFLAIDNVLGDEDGYFSRASDYNIAIDDRYHRLHLSSRDNNETFHSHGGPGGPRGGQMEGGGVPGQSDPLSRADDPARPLVRALFSHPQLRARYLAYVRTIAERWLDWEVLGPIYDQYVSLIDQDVWDDTKKLGSYEQFFDSATAAGGRGFGPFGGNTGLRSFVEQRREYLLSHAEIAKPAPTIGAVEHITGTGTGTDLGNRIFVTANIQGNVKIASAWLHYSTQMAAPFSCVEMCDDGRHHDGVADDGIFGGAIPGQPANSLVRFYVEARADESIGTVSFNPHNTEMGAHEVRIQSAPAEQPLVLINEFMPANGKSVQDPEGEFEDWIELHNKSTVDVDLSRMYLTDSEDVLPKWSFPPGTIIAAGGYLLVWADEDTGEGLHANFKLSKNGETISLVQGDGNSYAVVDQIRYETLTEEVSLGRLPDRDSEWEVMVPTPGKANRLQK
jgi:Ca2+-binding EF-hand superfamily protein